MKTRARETLIYSAIVLVLVLLAAMSAFGFRGTQVANAQAETTVSMETDGLTFLLNEDEQSYRVRVLDKTLNKFTIPSSYEGLPVTAIDDSGFTGCLALEEIIIPSSVTHIGNNAFMRCTNLKRVLGMSGITSYGNNAFSMCSNLEYLIFPSGLTNVGSSILRSVNATVYSRTLEEDLLQLNANFLTAFTGNIIYGNDLVYQLYTDPVTNEQGLTLASWQNIDLYANGFDEGTTLIVESWRSGNVGNRADGVQDAGKVLNIEDFAFADCNAESIIIRNAEGYNHTVNLESFAFALTKAKNISVEVNVTLNDPNDGDGESSALFYDNSLLQTVTLPNNLSYIPYQMFLDCKQLQEISFYNDNIEINHLSEKIKRIESQAFYSCYSLPELYISEYIEFIGQYAFHSWGTNSEVYQNIYIDLEKASENWNPSWDGHIEYNNCNVEFTAKAFLDIQFIVEQEGVIDAKGGVNLTVPRNETLNNLEMSIPTSENYIFSGLWYTTETRDEGTVFNGDRPIKTDLVLYAGWNIKTFSVTFPQANGCMFYDFSTNECIDSQLKLFEYGESYSFYVQTNYGYYDTQIFANQEILTPVSGDVYRLVVTDDLDLTVNYKLYEYTITYENLRGGINPNASIKKYTVESDTISFKAPSWPAAYEIGRWNIPYIEKGSIGNRVIRAIWERPKEYTITFIMDEDPNASNPNGAVKKYTIEDTVKLLDPVSVGYLSGSWKTEDGHIISGWNPGDYIENMTLHVNWGTGRQYEVRFDWNGGTGDSNIVIATYGSYLPSKSLPEREDYEFLGCISNNNGAQYYSRGMNGILKWYQTSGDTLQADWIQVVFTITLLQTNGIGTGGKTAIKLRYGQEWPTILMPVRKGYSFSGYYYMYDIENRKIYNSNGTYNKNNIVFPEYYNLTEDITLRGHWIADDYRFIIEKIHAMDDSATRIKLLYQEYEDVFQVETDERMMYTEYTQDGNSIVRKESRAFTRWIMNINGPDEYSSSNPWHVISTQRVFEFNIKKMLEKYYPNLDVSVPDSIHIRAVYLDDAKNETFGGCVAEGTLITLADGKQVPVEQLKGDENLLVWNLNTGKFDIAPILFIDKDPANTYEVVNLSFSDGTNVKVISEHGFWDITLNKYVYLDNNASQYIGHWFNKQITDENGKMSWTKVQLIDVTISEEFTTSWSPVTYGHLCYYVNGMLSMPGGINGMFNIFEVGEDMKYDIEAMEKDIETYGLYTYEEFAEILPVPEEMFNAVSGQYLKVAIGKGLITIEDIQKLISRYGVFFE